MAVGSELRARVRPVLGPVLAFCVIGYFAFHAVHGERGLIAWWHLKGEVAKTAAVATEVAARRSLWEERVARLRPETLSLDLLAERARLMLNYARPDDIVVLTVSRSMAMNDQQ